MPKFYGASRWDPKLISLQMTCMQCSHYLVRGLLLIFFHVTDVSFDHFFNFHSQTLSSVEGIENCVALLVAAFTSSICMCIFVERAKKCLDFGVTLYLIDLLLTVAYSGWPNKWEWWILHLGAVTLTVLIGEYLCSRQELEEIPMIDLFKKGHRARK